jgi:hypothetical protein
MFCLHKENGLMKAFEFDELFAFFARVGSITNAIIVMQNQLNFRNLITAS